MKRSRLNRKESEMRTVRLQTVGSGMFVSMYDVRKTFKNESANFQKGYFEAFNNPMRISKELPNMSARIDSLLVQGKLDKKVSDFYDGLKRGLSDRQRSKV